MPISTIGTSLKWGATLDAVTKITPIKSYPDLGGAPNMLEVTSLDDTAQSFINGVKANGQMEFTANYDSTIYANVVNDSETDLYYLLDLGEGGAFYWQGQHTQTVLGAGVDGIIEFKLYIAPSTEIIKVPSLLTVVIPGTPKQGTATGALTLTYSQTPASAPTLAYQWKLSATANGTYTNIASNGTSATYTPVAGDVDKFLKVEVTATVYASKVVLSTASAKVIAE